MYIAIVLVAMVICHIGHDCIILNVCTVHTWVYNVLYVYSICMYCMCTVYVCSVCVQCMYVLCVYCEEFLLTKILHADIQWTTCLESPFWVFLASVICLIVSMYVRTYVCTLCSQVYVRMYVTCCVCVANVSTCYQGDTLVCRPI